MKYLVKFVILVLFTINVFNSTESFKKRNDYSSIIDEYDILDQKMDAILSSQVTLIFYIKLKINISQENIVQ